jgi:Fungal specific transcription factor domain
MVAPGYGYPVCRSIVHGQTCDLILDNGTSMATDLNLHRKTTVTIQDTEESRARVFEVHNRERTWLTCFNLDKSLSAQMGKPHTIKEE